MAMEAICAMGSGQKRGMLLEAITCHDLVLRKKLTGCHLLRHSERVMTTW
jgi:hypothetical protein